MVTLNLSREEAQLLINLLDACVKAHGLQVAEPAVGFARAISVQLNHQQPVNVEDLVNSSMSAPN